MVAFAMAAVADAQAGEWDADAEGVAPACRVGTALHCSGWQLQPPAMTLDDPCAFGGRPAAPKT